MNFKEIYYEAKLRETEGNGFLTKGEAYQFLMNKAGDFYGELCAFEVELDDPDGIDNLLVFDPHSDDTPIVYFCDGNCTKYTIKEFLNDIFQDVQGTYIRFKTLKGN